MRHPCSVVSLIFRVILLTGVTGTVAANPADLALPPGSIVADHDLAWHGTDPPVCCVVPAWPFIFFPIINTVVTTMPRQTHTCTDVRAEVAENNDPYVHLVVEIDGVRIPDLHQPQIAPETCFDLAGRAPATVAPMPFHLNVTDGFCPPAPGNHRIEFRAF